MVVAVDVRITGLVQGVSFRWYTRERAREFGVAGWVRNETDGSVVGHFEGEAEQVQALVAWCRQGPDHARVQHVEIESADPGGESGFRIRP